MQGERRDELIPDLPAPAPVGPSGITPAVQQIVVSTLATTGNLVAAARAARTTAKAVRDRAKIDVDFAMALDEAWRDYTDGILIPEAHRRAVEGVEEPVFFRGEPAKDEDGRPARLRKYSDTLLIRLLERRDPAFRPHHVVEARPGPGPEDLQKEMTDEERAKLEELLRSRLERRQAGGQS